MVRSRGYTNRALLSGSHCTQLEEHSLLRALRMMLIEKRRNLHLERGTLLLYSSPKSGAKIDSYEMSASVAQPVIRIV